MGIIKNGKLLLEGRTDEVVERYRLAEFFAGTGADLQDPEPEGPIILKRSENRWHALLDQQSRGQEWLETHGAQQISLTRMTLEDLSVLLALGAGAFYLFHPGDPFPVGRLALAGLFTMLWFGTGFTMYFHKTPPIGWGGNWQAILVNVGATALFIRMTFGFALWLNTANNTVKCGVFLVSGLLLTAVGWRRACQFSPGVVRPSVPPRTGSVLTPLASADTRDLVRASRATGAISFLLQSTFARIF